MGAKRETEEDVVTLTLPRSALTVIAAPPATVSQRNCLATFGLSRDDYLKLAGREFAVKRVGKLRVAAYEDVRNALAKGRAFTRRARPAPEPSPEPTDEPSTSEFIRTMDGRAALVALGFVSKR